VWINGLSDPATASINAFATKESSEFAALTIASARPAALLITEKSASVPSTGSMPEAFNRAALSCVRTRPET
jgi:hypothetical protein